jgi:hypothetical protein
MPEQEKTKLEILKERFTEYLKAESHILKGGQEYVIGDREIKRGDLRWVQKQISELANDIAKEEAGNKIRVKRVSMRFDT